jgi:hypothetical protein
VFRLLFLFSFSFFLFSSAIIAQTNKGALPAKMFYTLRDSTTQADVVFNFPATTSLSMEGRNVKMFNSLLDVKTAKDTLKKADGFVMWLINGREYIMGDFFLGEKESYLRFKKDTSVYVNRLTEQGASFFKQQKK